MQSEKAELYYSGHMLNYSSKEATYWYISTCQNIDDWSMSLVDKTSKVPLVVASIFEPISFFLSHLPHCGFSTDR